MLVALVGLQLPQMLEAGGPLGGVGLQFKKLRGDDLARAVQKVKEKATPGADTFARSVRSGAAQAHASAKDAIGDVGAQGGLTNTSIKKAQQDVQSSAKEQLASVKEQLVDVREGAEQAVGTVAAAVDKGVTPSGPVAEVAQDTSSESLASQIRQATPGIARAVNRTSSQFADVLARTGSQASGFLNQTGYGLAARISGVNATVGALPDVLPLLQAPQRKWLASSGLVFVGLLLCSAYVGIRLKGRSSSRRIPVLLHENLMGDAPEARAPSLRTAPEEPLVSD